MKFHEQRFAEEYHRRLESEGYPGILLETVLSEIKDAKSILDVGAGSGFFALPLLKMGYHVTAIEPSNVMINILQKNLPIKYQSYFKIYPMTWESWQAEKHDALIAIHSIYIIKDLKTSLQKMKNSSKKSIIIISKDSGTNTLSKIIRKEFNTNKCSSGFFDKLSSALNDLNIEYKKYEIEQIRINKFTDLEKETNFYCYHLDIEEASNSKVKDIIKNNSELTNNGYLFKSTYRDYVITF